MRLETDHVALDMIPKHEKIGYPTFSEHNEKKKLLCCKRATHRNTMNESKRISIQRFDRNPAHLRRRNQKSF